MENIIELDKHLTLWLNSWHSDFFDYFYYMVTSTTAWIPFFVVLAWMVFRKQGVQGLFTLICVGLLIVVADQLASHVFKPLFERPRPSHDDVMQWMVHLVNGRRGGEFGFVSSHAANSFALATFMMLVVRNGFLSLSLFTWALLNSYSRIYNGMHFVGDILCGALLGIILSVITYQIYLRLVYHFFVIPHHNKRTLKSGLGRMFGSDAPLIAGMSMWFSLAILLIISALLCKYHMA
ncbi:MAG: phosphatase PAP2 family protein [Marinilabiliaceae bacterium]|nr:phosphatase PAP2 family protein [Marinilabiliaceae bacterium]